MIKNYSLFLIINFNFSKNFYLMSLESMNIENPKIIEE
jgi:hypothetical protein